MGKRFLPVATVVSIALGACGGAGNDRPGAEARLVLDAPPNAVHAGIYLAEARGFTDAEGVDLRIEVPGAATDAVDLLLSSRVQLAVLDLREVILGPEEASGVLVDRADGLERRVVEEQLDAVLPAFTAGGNAFGALNLPALERWAAWSERFGATRGRPDVARMFEPRFARQGVIRG